MGARIDDKAYNRAFEEVAVRERNGMEQRNDKEPVHQTNSMSPTHKQHAIDALFARLDEPEIESEHGTQP
jgi:hypothetical protein